MERRVAIEEALAHLPLMLSVEQTCEVLGIGRSLAYGQVRRYLATGGREGIPAVRIGSSLRVPRTGLVELLLSAPAPACTDDSLLPTVTTIDMAPTRSRRRRARSTRAPAPSVAQLPFASSD